jgi:hypothetical protein
MILQAKRLQIMRNNNTSETNTISKSSDAFVANIKFARGPLDHK